MDPLAEISRALEHLRAGSKNPADPAWRTTVLDSAASISRSVAQLLDNLKTPRPRDMTDDHLRAQRFARVRVAELSLYQSSQVKAGRETRNLYSALKPQIDSARENFREQFLTGERAIPDYLHQELVLALAHNDISLLGPDYPGPLA